jgi:hypothetical protein
MNFLIKSNKTKKKKKNGRGTVTEIEHQLELAMLVEELSKLRAIVL